MKLRSLLSIAALLVAGASAIAQNPYLPLWEYIPDGEPYVFEDPDCPGKYRVYVYGSHDDLVDKYCGKDQVVWSAPVDNLDDWRYDGIVFTSIYDANGELLNEDGTGDILYAPDVAVRVENGKKMYYFYPNNQAGGRQTMVAASDRPDGPFKVINWNKENPRVTDGCLTFDPGVFVDDDGRVYGYWGFEHSYCAELDPVTMASVKPGTEITNEMISSNRVPGDFSFFEASSIRKIEDKYVFVYSRRTREGEFGLPFCNYTLAYAYSDNPLGPWTYGGTIIDGRARDKDENGNVIWTAYPYGNTHGSIIEIGGQWWVFYHRQAGTDEFSRQAMVAPIELSIEKGKGGKVTINEAEYNSEGFHIEGLNPLNRYSAGIACYLTNPDGNGENYPNFFFTGSYIKATRVNAEHEALASQREPFCPIVNNTAGSVVGYKYFNFDQLAGAKKVSLDIDLEPQGNAGTITILVGGPNKARGGKEVGRINVGAGKDGLAKYTAELKGVSSLKGKQPLFFVFSSDKKGESICDLYALQFRTEK